MSTNPHRVTLLINMAKAATKKRDGANALYALLEALALQGDRPKCNIEHRASGWACTVTGGDDVQFAHVWGGSDLATVQLLIANQLLEFATETA